MNNKIKAEALYIISQKNESLLSELVAFPFFRIANTMHGLAVLNFNKWDSDEFESWLNNLDDLVCAVTTPEYRDVDENDKSKWHELKPSNPNIRPLLVMGLFDEGGLSDHFSTEDYVTFLYLLGFEAIYLGFASTFGSDAVSRFLRKLDSPDKVNLASLLDGEDVTSIDFLRKVNVWLTTHEDINRYGLLAFEALFKITIVLQADEQTILNQKYSDYLYAKKMQSEGGKSYGMYLKVMEALTPYIKRFWAEELEEGGFITRRKDMARLVLDLIENYPHLFPISGNDDPTLSGIEHRINVDCQPLPEQATRSPKPTKREVKLITKLHNERSTLIVNERSSIQ